MTDSLFSSTPDLVPGSIDRDMSVSQLVEYFGTISFEARNVWRGATLFQRMIEAGDTTWLGIAGAGIAGGMGGIVIDMLRAGFIDVICSTGAQVYHDLHFAFELPVKQIPLCADDNELRKHGDARIYDIGIREKETLQAQDDIVRKFLREQHQAMSGKPIATWEFNYQLGQWVGEHAKQPARSFVATAAELGVPIFWDSHTNHSIAMNIMRANREGCACMLSADRDIFDSAALVYGSEQTGFVQLGGGGPKNFIQQTGPTLSQVLSLDFHGVDRGLQIGTATEREGSLSGCTFSEAVTWGKYESATPDKLVHIWGDYSVIFPLLGAYALDQCADRSPKRLIDRMPDMIDHLESSTPRQT